MFRKMLLTLAILLTIIVFIPAIAVAQGETEVNKGYEYYKEGNYKEALTWFRQAADKGNAIAQNNLGYMYDNGLGVEKNYVEAVKWYRKAADQGNADAGNNLGCMYYNGLGVEKSDTEAVKWLYKAAKQGNVAAYENLVNMAENGNADAQYNLGIMYEVGLGVKKSITEAKKWYTKAADQGCEATDYALWDL